MVKHFPYLLIVLLPFKIFSQEIPAFKPLRYDEDYGNLRNDSSHQWYRMMKFNALSKDKNSFVSFGGETRFQYFYAHNEMWGDAPKDSNGYVLTRLLFHADLHAGKAFRTFIQLQSSIAGSRIDPNPVEDNPLELHQGFIDLVPVDRAKSKLIFRVGRQELSYGSQRIIAVRDNPNNRQSFDAAKVVFLTHNYKIDGFYAHYVAAKDGIFDDRFNKNTKLWGGYIVRNKIPVIENIDIYYLGLWKKEAVFNDGDGKELRHSFGSRIWGNKQNWRYDIEGLYQFGKFAAKNISGWTTSINTSYMFNEVALKPELGLKTEIISGDKKVADDKLQTFNPLFPRGAYFGLAALIGPVNLVDIHPSVSLNFSEKVKLDIDYDIFRRQKTADGIYAANVSLIYPDKNSQGKKIGNQLAGSLGYTPNNFLFFRAELTWFNAGPYLKSVGTGKDILFTGVTAQLKF